MKEQISRLANSQGPPFEDDVVQAFLVAAEANWVCTRLTNLFLRGPRASRSWEMVAVIFSKDAAELLQWGKRQIPE